MSDFDRRFKAALHQAAKAGITGNRADPPINRVLRKFGFQPRPPHYASFGKNVVSQGLWFGAIWGLLMYFLVWQDQGMSVLGILVSFVGTAVVFGLLMAYIYATASKRYGLSDWEDL